MNFTPPPDAPAEAAPIPSRRLDSQEQFDAKSDAYMVWLAGFRTWLATFRGWCVSFLSEIGLAVQQVEDSKAVAQFAANAAAASASVAAVAANAPQWVAKNYTFGDCVFSPLNLLTYRRATAGTTASANDPSVDPTGWKLVGALNSMPQVRLTTAGPHQLKVGFHYLIEHPLAKCLMPTAPSSQDALRISNKSGAISPILRRNGQLFNGFDDDMLLDSLVMDRTFTFSVPKGWI